MDWTFAGDAYDGGLEWDDGTKDTINRRERPQVLVIKGEPAVLFTGTEINRLGGAKHTFTLAQVNFAFKKMDYVLQMMDFSLKMMDFVHPGAGHRHGNTGGGALLGLANSSF